MLYKEATREKISRQQFLFQLAEELAGEFQDAQQKEQEDIQEKSITRFSFICEKKNAK